MPEEPEQVLPQERIASLCGIEDMRADETVEDQERRCDHDRGHGEDDQECGDQHRPYKERDSVEGHAGRALLENGHDDLDCDRQRGNLREGDHLRPDVGAFPRRIFGTRQGHIGEPADIRTDIEHEGDPDHEPAQHVDVIAEGVEARECDVARADHERNKVNRESFHHRYGE